MSADTLAAHGKHHRRAGLVVPEPPDDQEKESYGRRSLPSLALEVAAGGCASWCRKPAGPKGSKAPTLPIEGQQWSNDALRGAIAVGLAAVDEAADGRTRAAARRQRPRLWLGPPRLWTT